MLKLALKTAIAATLLASVSSFASDFDSTKAKIEAAMDADIRSEKEVERDRNRKPVSTLEFFGLREDMKIIELLPGGGWYTKLLVPAVSENGEYYAAFGTSRVKERLADKAGFDKMNIIAEDANIYRKDDARFYSIELPESALGITGADMVFTFRNYHNFAEDGRMAMNKAAFDALKPGGIYAVVDHTARHMEEQNSENRRRFDPVRAIKEIQAAGFELVDFSDLHYRKDDELIYEVGRRSVAGNTDRWTIKFRKPE